MRSMVTTTAAAITATITITIVPMTTDRHRATGDIAPLLVWLSPSFPIGSYAYSHGLEWAVEAGDIRDLVSLEAWIATLLDHGGPWSDAVLFALAYKAALAGDDEKLREIVELAAALSSSRERKLETLNQGAAFLAAIRAAWPCALLEKVKLREQEVAFPVAVALSAAGHNLGLLPSLEAYLVALLSNLVSAAVRLVPLGQTDGTKAIAGLVPRAKKVVLRAADASIDDVGGAALLSDIASMRHETQYTRLFRS